MSPPFLARQIFRGTLLPAILAVLLVLPCPSPGAAKTLGLVMPLCCDFGDPTKEKFIRYLQQAGMAPQEAEILVQRPGTDKISILNSIRKLAVYEVSPLVVFGASATREALAEAKNIPVVFIGAYDPVKEGLVMQLDRPGTNATGVSCKTSLPFLLDNMQETIGAAGTLGIIFHADNADSLAQVEELKELAGKRSLRTIFCDLKTTVPAAAASALAPSQFIYLAAGCYPDFIDQSFLNGLAKPIATQCQNAGGTDAVFILAPDNDETLLEAAKVTMRIFRGEKPAQVAVSGAKKIDFVINLSAAQNLGLKIPFTVLSRATKVIK